LPVSTGGFLSDSDWKNVGTATSANPITIYTGTVAQLVATSLDAGSMVSIRDTYENIK
jgi:hypothetical protein